MDPKTTKKTCESVRWMAIGVVVLVAAFAIRSSTWLQDPLHSPATDHAQPSPDVLLITLDTARWDHFSYTGASPVSTPSMDALASESAVFTTAIAPVPLTLPSHATLLTGNSPTTHGVRVNGVHQLPPDAITLAEQLSAQGYSTAAFIAATVLDHKYGLDQGFTLYDDDVGAQSGAGFFQYPRRPGLDVVQSALEWLSSRPADTPTFVWVHLFDAHAPYPTVRRTEQGHQLSEYSAGVSDADTAVGSLLEGYRALDRYDSALIIATADHGESLGEHGEATHGIFIYDSTLRVPLLVRPPGRQTSTTHTEQVALEDVTPTVLGIVGISPPEMDGIDLTETVLRGAKVARRTLYIESYAPRLQYGWNELVGLRSSQFKLVSGTTPELYDISQDSEEMTDLSRTQAKQLETMLEELEPLVQSPIGATEEIPLDQTTREQLQALGYVWSAPLEKADSNAPRPDPREQIGILSKMEMARQRYSAGDSQGAFSIYRKLIEDDPENSMALSQFADMLASTSLCSEAIELYAKASLLVPTDPALHSNRGICLERTGRVEEALEAYSKALSVDAKFTKARSCRWDLLTREGDQETVAEEARLVVLAAPHDTAALVTFIQAEHASGSRADLQSALEEAVLKHPEDTNVIMALARLKASQSDFEGATELCRKVLDIDPSHIEARWILGRLLLGRDQVEPALEVLEPVANDPDLPASFLVPLGEARARSGDTSGALSVLARAVAMDPTDPIAWSTLGSTQFAAGRLELAAESYLRALELDAPDTTTVENLIRVYGALGKVTEAQGIRERFGGGGSESAP